MGRRAVIVAITAVALAHAVCPTAVADSSKGRVVIVTLPGVAWNDLLHARVPTLRRLIETGAVAAMSTRGVVLGSTPLRGYLTLGAGDRTFADASDRPRRDGSAGQVALAASTPVGGGTAGQEMTGLVRRPRAGDIVVPDLPLVTTVSERLAPTARVGALGESLARAGVSRSIVGAADVSTTPSTDALRRAAALALVDEAGSIDHGVLDGLLRVAPDAPFGVETDPVRFQDAVHRALESARVVVIEPGETLRADEFSLVASSEKTSQLRRRALERADALIAGVVASLSPHDVLYVVGVSSPLTEKHDHLSVMVAHGRDVARGWLTSPTTHRPGIVTLPDVAPTVLHRLGLTPPASMSGTPIHSVAATAKARLAILASLDRQSVFGDRFVGVVTKLMIGLLILAAIAFAGFLLVSRSLVPIVAWVAFAILAVPPVAVVARIVRVDRLGLIGASVVVGALICALATTTSLLPSSTRTRALLLVAVSFTLTAGDLLAGAHAQLNGVFGYSPISGGRFYGTSNVEFAVLVSTAILLATGVAQASRRPSIPAWTALLFAGVVLVDGLPQFGANFGSVLASVPAMLVVFALGRERRVRLSRAALWAAGAAACGLGATLIDLLRPPQARTHLGRFVARVASGGPRAFAAIVLRKAQSDIGSFHSAWAWAVPVAVAVYLLARWQRPAHIKSVLRNDVLLRAGVAGTLLAGVLGLAVKDTGMWVLGMTVSYTLPFVLLSVSDGAR